MLARLSSLARWDSVSATPALSSDPFKSSFVTLVPHGLCSVHAFSDFVASASMSMTAKSSRTIFRAWRIAAVSAECAFVR
jgi:hypothetical protein